MKHKLQSVKQFKEEIPEEKIAIPMLEGQMGEKILGKSTGEGVWLCVGEKVNRSSSKQNLYNKLFDKIVPHNIKGG